MFETVCMNRERNSEYRDVRSRKKFEMNFFNILRHRPSFSNFSENTGDGTLIFSIYVEKGCVFGNKWKKSKSKYQTCPQGPEAKIEMSNVICARKMKWYVNSQN